MREIDIPLDLLVERLLRLKGERNICLLDSCGVGKTGSNLLIAGIDPVETLAISDDDPEYLLSEFDRHLGNSGLAAVFTMSYDLGLKLNRVAGKFSDAAEPDIFFALFDGLIIHDYNRRQTFISGRADRSREIEEQLLEKTAEPPRANALSQAAVSNFTRSEYSKRVNEIKELIRAGETYQANLTQQLKVSLGDGLTPANIFRDLRRDHPAPFAAYINRGGSIVVSASPEQFLCVETSGTYRTITASPIKGTTARGSTKNEDDALRAELLASEKDRAENTMIVDLMRNDLGRVCKFGSVAVEDLCSLEKHPTLFHLVSTIHGRLRDDTTYSDIIRAVFPCGSITGAPKIRTMEIIDRLETAPRGLSMGAIGCRIPAGTFGIPEAFEMSVAIRTMVIRDNTALFNVGGGVVIDSDPGREYEESMLKAKALLRALNSKIPS